MVRTLRRVDISQENGTMRIEFEGDGFLYNMVRILTGTLVEIGLEEKSAEELPGILASRKRANAGITAPAQGLILWDIRY